MARLNQGHILAERYVVEAELGGGATGAVYLAHDPNDDVKVAIKVLWPELSQLDEARSRFDREARALSGLQHPNVISVREFGIDGQLLFLVMEYLDGEGLDHLLDRERLRPEAALRIADQCLAGLAFAHQMGVVHRDVKPANVFLAGGGEGVRAKLLDFGLAKFADRASWGVDETLTAAGATLGTPGYMPPEQAFGSKVDARCDVYSAGVLVYELLTGQWPFDADELPDLLRAHAVEPVPPMNRARPSLDVRPELDAVVQRAMAKRPEDRFPDASAFREALKAVPKPAAVLA